MKTRTLTIAVLLFGMGTAAAQDGSIRMTIQPGARPPNSMVRVSLNMSFPAGGVSGLSDQAVEGQEQARRRVYELVAHECALLRDTIASDCRLETMSIGMNRFPNPQGDNVTFQVNANYQVTLK